MHIYNIVKRLDLIDRRLEALEKGYGEDSDLDLTKRNVKFLKELRRSGLLDKVDNILDRLDKIEAYIESGKNIDVKPDYLEPRYKDKSYG